MAEVSSPDTALPFSLRHAEPSDYAPIVSVVNAWWGGVNVAPLLHKLFFVHFRPTSFVAETDGRIVGFLVGFVSQTFSDEAYLHFAGVHPDYRKRGVARALYERFFAVVQEQGRAVVRCVTSPSNRTSILFHRRLGFTIEPGDGVVDGVPVHRNDDGCGGDRVLFVKRLTP